MKNYYWSGNSVIELFLGGPNCEFLFRELEKCGSINTAACTVAEFYLAVARAIDQGRLVREAGDDARATFDSAVKTGQIRLLADDSSLLLAATELNLDAVRDYLPSLNPTKLIHLLVATENNFRHFVDASDDLAPICKIWALHCISPRSTPKETAALNSSLEQALELFSQLQRYVDDLVIEGDSEPPAAAPSLASESDPIDDPIPDARRSFFDAMDEVKNVSDAANDKLTDWATDWANLSSADHAEEKH